MKTAKPLTRIEANKPKEVEHLKPGQKKALDTAAEIEHTDGKERERLTHEARREGEKEHADE